MIDLSGKRIAVIGAGSVGSGWGNGKAAATLFAKLGAKVICVDRLSTAADETAQIIAGEGHIAHPLELDVTVSDAGEQLLSFCENRLDGIDILHYNVGISSKGGAINTTDEEWQQVFDVNLNAAFRMTRAVLTPMRKQKSGALIYVSSLAAIYTGPYSYVSYEASKAALCRFSRSVAQENAAFTIRANTILPGAMDTPHVQQFVDSKTDKEELAEKRASMVPMKRQGSAWDVAHAAAFLASDSAGYITGIDLRVDGGLGM